jgi:outer membrane protein TolC
MVGMRDWQTRSAKLDWTRYFQLFSEARFGAVDYVVIGAGVNPATDNTFRYNVGTRIQLNAFDIIDQKKKVRTAEAVLDFEKAKVEEAKRVIIDEVIKQYNQVITYREIVKIKSDNLQGQLANMEKMELKFATGDEDLMEYARIKEISTKAQEEFELAKKEFRVAYMLLENLVGVKLDQISGKN